MLGKFKKRVAVIPQATSIHSSTRRSCCLKKRRRNKRNQLLQPQQQQLPKILQETSTKLKRRIEVWKKPSRLCLTSSLTSSLEQASKTKLSQASKRQISRMSSTMTIRTWRRRSIALSSPAMLATMRRRILRSVIRVKKTNVVP